MFIIYKENTGRAELFVIFSSLNVHRTQPVFNFFVFVARQKWNTKSSLNFDLSIGSETNRKPVAHEVVKCNWRLTENKSRRKNESEHDWWKTKSRTRHWTEQTRTHIHTSLQDQRGWCFHNLNLSIQQAVCPPVYQSLGWLPRQHGQMIFIFEVHAQRDSSEGQLRWKPFSMVAANRRSLMMSSEEYSGSFR